MCAPPAVGYPDMTSLGGRKETIDFNIYLSLPLSFVFEHPAKHSPATVTDGFGEVVVLDHAFDMQILYSNHLV